MFLKPCYKGPQMALDAYLYVKNLKVEVEMVKINPEKVLDGNLQVDKAVLDSILKNKDFQFNTNIKCLKMEKTSEGGSNKLPVRAVAAMLGHKSGNQSH